MITKQRITSLISKLLKKEFQLDELKIIRKLIDSGEMSGVFSRSVNAAINSAEADDFQDQELRQIK